jgi:predicted dehydrogenase
MAEKKRILIVGAGGIGLKHIRAFSSLSAPPALAAVDPRPEAGARAKELGVEVLDKSWEDLHLPDFDGIVICAPAPKHVPFVTRCLGEGVPVLSEKPLSQEWDGVEELIRLSRQPNAPATGIAYTRRYVPAHEQAAEMVRSGKLGDVATARIIAGQPFTTYRPDYRQTYYASRAMGGGCVLDFTSHFIDLLQFYLGPIKAARGFKRHSVLEGVEVEDTVAMALDFESGVLGTVHVNQYQPVNENIIDFCGADSCLRMLEPGFTGKVFRSGSEEWQDLVLEPGDYAEALKRQAGAFLAAIDGGPAMHTSIAEAANTLRACLDVLDRD